MEKKMLNRYTAAGLLAYSATNIAGHLFHAPEFIKGLGYGLVISLILLGALSERHDLNKIRIFKRNLMTKVLR